MKIIVFKSKFVNITIVLILLLISCDIELKENMSYYEFSKLVKNEIQNNDDELSVEKAIKLSKIHNTIFYNRIYNMELFNKFNKLVFEKKRSEIFDILECEISIGMGAYSKKYSLLIGGSGFLRGSYVKLTSIPPSPHL